ncbi:MULTISPECIES: hypothetical protein [unclassified Rhizobium]|uniref:hypothetical protein n=1 Tax=unclassified Rhizobium TaxID=2613769 RepID=UPI0018EE2AA3
MTATKGQFFKKTASIRNDKATTTDSLAKSIVAAENTAREKKTEALRALRLQQEATEELKADKPAKEKKKAVRRSSV